MGEIRVAQLEVAPRAGENSTQQPLEPPLDSSLVEMNWGELAPFSGPGANGGEQLAELRFMDTKTVALRRDVVNESRIPLLPELPFVAARQEKYFAEASHKEGSSRSRRWRRVSRQPRDNPLQLNVDFLVLATGFSLGVIGSRSSANCRKGRVQVKDSSLGRRTRRRTRRRTIKDKGRHASLLVEPYLIAYDAGDAFSKHWHRTMSMSCDGDRSEDRQSEEVQSGYKRDNELDEDIVTRTNFGVRHIEEQNDETDWSWVLKDKDGDPLAESISSLQTTQEVLESEVQKLSDLAKDSEGEESSSGNNGQDVIVLAHGGVVLEMNEKMQYLEQKLKEASDTIRQKDLRISNLETVIDSAQRPLLEEDAANIVQLEMEVERQLQDRIQAEIQWLVMVKAKRNWQVRAEDQITLKEHRSSAGDNTETMLKLRDTESKIVMLKEQVDKLEVHEKELYRTTEVLKVQSRTFKVSLFGLLQLIMLCLSLKMFFEQAPVVPFGDVVPT